MSSPFEVDLGKRGMASPLGTSTSGLTETARRTFGIKEEGKETNMPVKETEDMPVVEVQSNMTITAPKRFWEVFGAFNISLRVKDTPEIILNLERILELWSTLDKEFAEELAVSDEASPEQVSFIRQLCATVGEDVPENIKEMTKAEASVVINNLMKDRDGRGQTRGTSRESSTRRSTPRREFRSSRQSDTDGGRYSRKPGGYNRRPGQDNPATNRQKDYIERLCRDAGEDVPEELDDFTYAEADAFIKARV